MNKSILLVIGAVLLLGIAYFASSWQNNQTPNVANVESEENFMVGEVPESDTNVAGETAEGLEEPKTEAIDSDNTESTLETAPEDSEQPDLK